MIFFGYSVNWLNIHDLWILSTAMLVFLMIFDDIFVDILAFFVRAKPRPVSSEQMELMNSLDQKKIAIMIANWHESNVLERVVKGNIANIDYSNYDIFLGVYKNDIQTFNAAKRLSQEFKNVKVVVNSMFGPTSKGQMINEVVNHINTINFNSELKSDSQSQYEIYLTHDAEDIIHKFSLKLINLKSRNFDFIQIPVFSFRIPNHKVVAGVYMDEFVESHTQNLIVRDYFRSGVPSAGVGTAVSRSVVAQLLKLQNGYFLNERTLTEDYYLGLTCYDLNIKAHFAAEYIEKYDKIKKINIIDYIATREYFPTHFMASVRQKTRWIMGICLQGYEQKKRKSGNFFASYFLWRDRKNLWAAPVFVLSLLFISYYLLTFLISGRWPYLNYSPYQQFLNSIIWVNLALSVSSVLRRMFLVAQVYDIFTSLMVPVRWLVSYFVNNIATFNAVGVWGKSKIKGQLPKWSKTDHLLPVGFGLVGYDFIESEAQLPIDKFVLPEKDL